MLYNDPLVVAGVATGGMAGYMTNPEDYIDTVNSKMGYESRDDRSRCKYDKLGECLGLCDGEF
jgi:hypothetical protein